MSLELEIKKNDPKTLLLLWEGEVWREVGKSLFINELRKFPPGLSWEDFLSRFTLLEDKVGKRYAIYLLSQRALLSSDLETRLVSKGISLPAAKAVVGFCREKKYLDDSQEIARLVAKELKKGQSAKAVLFKLRQKKGISEIALREHLQSAAPSDADALQKWMSKLGKKIDRSDPAEMRKLMAKLCRRGFSPDLVFKAFDDI
ncbi:MAG: RecX family transcriptional regulator [Verrucomicrobia bacterium]|nr:RecX family transcriptional regulator [Verrucomicrobiota bacterium]